MRRSNSGRKTDISVDQTRNSSWNLGFLWPQTPRKSGFVRPVTVYWRPGCVFCADLIRDLDRAGVPYEARNIWEDEEAASFVRSVANGNETVPTVTVGEQAMVNPAAARVVAAAAN